MSHVEVSTARIEAVGGEQARQWFDYSVWLQGLGRLHTVSATLGGEIVQVSCFDTEDAYGCADVLVRLGIPASAVKVVA